jgi:D-xylose reductase
VGEGIARGIAAGLCTREELWVTSKLWNTFTAPSTSRLRAAVRLTDFGLDYFDLYLDSLSYRSKLCRFRDRYPPEWVFDPLPKPVGCAGMQRDAVPLSAPGGDGGISEKEAC